MLKDLSRVLPCHAAIIVIPLSRVDLKLFWDLPGWTGNMRERREEVERDSRQRVTDKEDKPVS